MYGGRLESSFHVVVTASSIRNVDDASKFRIDWVGLTLEPLASLMRLVLSQEEKEAGVAFN
jgi:cell division ATPase FtsA